MTAESSYKNYREYLANSSYPGIPYMGVYLIDLTYMEDGNPDMIENRINYLKRDMISVVIQKIQSFQEASNAGGDFNEEVCPPQALSLTHFLHITIQLMQLLWNMPESSSEYERLIWVESKARE